MAQLRQAHAAITAAAGEVVVVGPETPERFREFWEEERLPFVGLPDPRHEVLKRYGQEVNLFRLGRMPAQLIVDTAGLVRWVHYGHSMADIPAPAEVLELLESLSPASRPQP